jgi:aryl-alcohol dehydrogenase-like predicted oxidoreductase
MEYRNIGGSGCAVSAFALGAMSFGDGTNEAGAFAQLDTFAEDGGTLVGRCVLVSSRPPRRRWR